MKKQFILISICLLFAWMNLQGKSDSTPIIYIDGNGVMRWSDTQEEASFFGTNYTLPFAHSYRALGYLGLDRKAAIDKDVYHLSRLGLNAYRIHLWDVELTDGQGNLLENEHLDLMDYLMAKLKERNIYIVITAQTNFGNGYPERNEQTGGFSYQYDKCSIHDDAEAIAAQEKYLHALVKHVNPYTGVAYKDDASIVGFEINNEPCHSGTKEEVKAYINRMLKAMKKAGNRKPVFYNVSHNGYVVEAYYETGVQGTTYQWYPIGLVAGHTQRGNFLPYVDRYDIPFAGKVKDFHKKTRMVYEFDPADILYSYMYPAMVRTFRTAGFQWITQFAYDPMDIAYANTEYQTHYLNLAYTPRKAISMKIAAEAAQSLKRGESYGSYPQDTLFGDGFRVSYTEDLSELNNGKKFYYSNTTRTMPGEAAKLVSIAGCGSSPVVRYEGTGAYFLDCLEPGVWRLEVMPDAITVNDPFAKPSLEKEVVTIVYGSWDMGIDVPDLGKEFTLTALDKGNSRKEEKIVDGVIRTLRPGVYLLKREGCTPAQRWTADSQWNAIRIGEYVAPTPRTTGYKVVHTPATVVEAGKPLTVEASKPLTVEAGKPLTLKAEIAGSELPDSVIIYTDKVSFWNERNPYIKMKRTNGYTYQATIPAAEIKEGYFRYNIIVCRGGNTYTYPAGDSATGNSGVIKGNPLDWDYTSGCYRTIRVVAPGSAIKLWTPDDQSGIETYTLPEWNELQRTFLDESPTEKPLLRFTFTSKGENPHHYLRTLVKDRLDGRKEKVKECTALCIRVNGNKKLPQGLSAGFITSDGYTYKSLCPAPTAEGIIRIPFTEFRQTDTALLPIAYPTFLNPYFHPETEIPFLPQKIEKLELSMPGIAGTAVELELGEVWME